MKNNKMKNTKTLFPIIVLKAICNIYNSEFRYINGQNLEQYLTSVEELI